MSTLNDELEILLGRSALDNDMQIPEDVQKLAKATRYLSTQIEMVCKNYTDDIEIAPGIIENVVKILQGY